MTETPFIPPPSELPFQGIGQEIDDRPEPGPVRAARRMAVRIGRIPHIGAIAMGGAALCVAVMALAVALHSQERARAATGGEAVLFVNADAADAPPGQFIPDAFTLAPEAVRDLAPDAARAINAALPFATGPVQAARPFVMKADDLVHYTRALDCMTAAVYYEAGNETPEGQRAVAQVVINRMRHPAYPNTVCGVVFQGSERATGCQFTFTCDGALGRRPSATGWARARAVASAALNGAVAAEVGMATHYHTDWVAPYWAPRLTKLRQIGTHIFYRWPGAWGLTAAFRSVHPGAEPEIARLAGLATGIALDPVQTAAMDAGAPVTPLTLKPVHLVAPPSEPEPEAEAAPPPRPVAVAPTPARAPAPAQVVPANPLQPAQPQPARRPRLPTPGSW